MLDAWITEANQTAHDLLTHKTPPENAPLALAHLHASFERIHPFLDGNGRTGRLLLNLILVRLGWPPIVILKTHRTRYLAALASADANNPAPLAEIIARAAIASTHALLPTIAPPQDLLPLASFADPTLSLPALRQAAARGRLEAHLDPHGRWRTTRNAVEAYKARRYQR